MYKNAQKHDIKCTFTKKDFPNLLAKKSTLTVNSCNFFLLKLEEMKSCIYCIKAAYTWVRL